MCLKELGISEETNDNGQAMIRWNVINGKLDLTTSVTLLHIIVRRR